MCYQDVLPVYNKGNDIYTQSKKNGNISYHSKERVENSNQRRIQYKENLPLPLLSRTEVADEDMNRLPYSAIVSLTMDDKFTGNGVSVGRNGVLVGPCHISTCRHKPT